MAYTDEILLVGKGPSAAAAATCLSRPVAVINDAMKLFTGPVDYCIACDVEMLESSREHWNRVHTFVVPDTLHRNCRRDVTADVPTGFPLERCVRYPYKRHALSAWEFLASIHRREVVLRSGVTCALSYLCYQGFRRFRLIGFDGGTGYAPGVKEGTRPGIDYDEFLNNQLLLQALLEHEFGATFQWLSPSSSRRKRIQREWRRKTSVLFGKADPSSTS